jgi:hypothetical protein
MKASRFCLLLFVGFHAVASIAWSQTWYRSNQSGNWQDTLSWQTSVDFGSTWQQASTPPTGTEYIVIQGSHSITLTSSANLNRTRVDGQLTVPSGVSLTASGGSMPSRIERAFRITPSTIAVFGGIQLYGTLVNQGSFDISGPSLSAYSGSSVIFSGVSVQVIPAASYWDLQVNNPSGAQLSGGTQVDGSLTITKGNLHTTSSMMTLGAYATISESSQYRVLGILCTSRACTLGVNQSFGGMGVEINRSGGPFTVTFDVTRYTGEAPSVTAANAIARSFDISPSVNVGLNASLVLHYFPSELNGAAEGALVLYKSGGSGWINAGGSVNATAHAVSLSGIDSFSSWTAAAPIPVPTTTSISPSSGTRGSALSVNIVGNNFEAGSTTVGFNGSGITVNSVTVSSMTKLSAAVSIGSSASAGYRDVTVTNSYGSSTYSNGFQVQNPVPTVSGFSPANGSPGVSLSLTVRGNGFLSGATTVSIGSGITVNAVDVTNTNTLVASISIASGATLGPRSVTVTNPSPGGGSVTITSAFSVLPVPTLTGMAPVSGVRGQSLSILLAGSNFVSGGTSVEMGAGIAVDSVAVLSATQIRARAAISYAAATGIRDVAVSNSGGSSGLVSLPGGFSVMNPVPLISSISPSVIARGKTVTVVVAGSEFISGVTGVSFGSGVAIGTVTVISTTQLSVVVSASKEAVVGSRDVIVTNASPGGGSATSTGGFSVQNPAPLLSSVTPASGQLGQSLNVELFGSDFLGSASSVDFGTGVAVNSTSIDSTGNHITANISIASTAVSGYRIVKVTNIGPGGGVASLANGFTVTNPVPTLVSVTPNEGGKGQTLNLTLAGTNFITGTSSVVLGVGVTVNSVTVKSATSILVNISISPSAVIGARSLTVTNAPPGGGSTTLSFVFNVVNATPTISSIVPSTGTRGSLLSAKITGSNFSTPGTTLDLGTGVSIVSVVIASPTQMTADIVIASDAALGSRTVTVTNPLPGGGSASLSSGFNVTSGPATGVEGALGTVPSEFLLQEVYPNPFNPSTRIRYGIPEDSRIRITINNMLGNTVAQLVNGERSKGVYELRWHADNLPSGVYLLRMTAESLESSKRYISSRKLVFMK